MSILSKDLKAKLLGSEWSFGYNCYEVGHTWTPSCTAAALEVSLAAALKVLPLYGMLYSFSQLAIQRKYDLDTSWETSKSVLRSSFFIFFHAYNGSLMGCALRAGFGRFYYRVLVCLPGMISSYFALLIEKPSRRQALAFYLLNMASEILYRMMVTKKYFKPIQYGETLLFCLSLAAWYHIIKTEGFGHDPVSGAMKALIGRDEAKSRAKTSNYKTSNNDHKLRLTDTDQLGLSTDDDRPETGRLMEKHTELRVTENEKLKDQPAGRMSWFRNIVDCLKDQNIMLLPCKHPSCPHQESTCFEYVIAPLPSRFLLGYTIQSLLSVSKNPLGLLQSPLETLTRSFTHTSSIKFGLFLASLVSGGRLTSCLLRQHTNENANWHAPISGFIAGLSMLWAPRSSLSMYVMWKAVEQHYLMAARKGQVKYVDFTVQCIYSVSASIILYAFALEPRFIRPSYMKFLDNVSDHRLHQLNRMVLDVFGTGSSIGYEDFFPDLDPKLMSNQFKEVIFNWMIQPYE